MPPGQAKKDAPDGTKGNGKGRANGGKPDTPGRSGEARGKGKAKGKDKSNKNKVYDLELSYVNDILAPLPEVLATYDEQGQPRDTFVYGLQRLAGIGPDGKATAYLYDGLGSVRHLVDAQGSVFDRYTYSPFGLPEANGRLNPSHELNDGNTFGFGGQDHDPVFGMIYLRARYYTPGLGRFSTSDPLVSAGMDVSWMSSYAFGQDNPLSYMDPSGLTADKVRATSTSLLSSNGGRVDAASLVSSVLKAPGLVGIALPGGRLGNTPFKIRALNPEGSSTSTLVLQDLSKTRSNILRLDGPNTVQKIGWHINVDNPKTVPEVLKNANHKELPRLLQKVAPLTSAKNLSRIAYASVALSAGVDAYRVGRAFAKDNYTVGKNTVTTVGSVAGGWTGAIVGAKVGAVVGMKVGLLAGGGVGAAIGGVVGALAGGIIGGMIGSSLGEKAAIKTYEAIPRD